MKKSVSAFAIVATSIALPALASQTFSANEQNQIQAQLPAHIACVAINKSGFIGSCDLSYGQATPNGCDPDQVEIYSSIPIAKCSVPPAML